LKGQFWAAVRKDGTVFLKEGVLPLSSKLYEQYSAILDWLKNNNELYQDIVPHTSNDLDALFQRLIDRTVSITLSDSRAPINHSEGAFALSVPGNTQDTELLSSNNLAVPIKLRNKESNKLYFQIESALPLLFPLLFPFGRLPEIPGTTLRAKAQVLLQTHPLLRCGRLGCHLILYLFDTITSKEFNFYQNIQRLKIPEDSSRKITPNPRPEDPSFAEYWRRKLIEVRALSFHYGCPDVMLTFTFNNHWESVTLCKITNARLL
jgi:hypothetical protein